MTKKHERRAAEITAVLLLGAISFQLTSCSRSSAGAGEPAAPEVEVVTVEQKDIPVYREWIGTLDGMVNAAIRAQVTGYPFRCLTSSSLWRGASLTRAGRKFAVPSTYFASFVQSPCHLRLRPTSEPSRSPSDMGIQSLIHSSSRLRCMLAPAPSTRRTCEMARRSTGLQFAIHFRAKHTDPTG